MRIGIALFLCQLPLFEDQVYRKQQLDKSHNDLNPAHAGDEVEVGFVCGTKSKIIRFVKDGVQCGKEPQAEKDQRIEKARENEARVVVVNHGGGGGERGGGSVVVVVVCVVFKSLSFAVLGGDVVVKRMECGG